MFDFKGNKLKRILVTLICCSFLISIFPTTIYSEDNMVSVEGKVYKFGENAKYKFENEETSNLDTNVTLTINGNSISKNDENNISVYSVSGNEVSFSYSFNHSLKKEDEYKWHLVDDKSKIVNDVSLSSDILKGAVILQISNDRSKWVTVSESVNAFENDGTTSFYDVSELELLNGCYYRIIFAYKLGERVTSKIPLVVSYDYEKYAEVFEFYLYNKEEYIGTKLDTLNDSEKTKLGNRVRTEDEGYKGTKDIDKDDPHFGWSLGDFFVSGYTSKKTIDSNQYFLKNSDDTVTLGFYLKQDIDNLNGKSNLSISRDKKGYDIDFEVPETDFGRGTLIVQFIDPDGVAHDPQIYTNYLEANLSPRANTAVKLCEEGDYKVALDYEIKNDNKKLFGASILPEKTHYRIAFEFRVRNSNTRVFLFDCKDETVVLKNGSITQNGFKIDFANSKYLDVSVKKEILESGADGLTEDTKFNRRAKDQETYTEEGIYTITVENSVANLTTETKIYVGNDKILKAHMATGLPISEIKEKVSKGAVILNDGTIKEKSGKEIEKVEEIEENNEIESTTTPESNTKELILPEESNKKTQNITDSSSDYGVVIGAIVLTTLILVFVHFGKKRKNKGNTKRRKKK